MIRALALVSRYAAVALFIGICAGLIWMQNVDARRGERSPLQLEFEARTQDFSQGRLIVDGHRVVNFQLPRTHDFSPAAIPIPEGIEPISSIRIDPLQQPGEFLFRNARITRDGNELVRIRTEHLEALNPRSPIEETPDGWRVRMTSGADYPVILLSRVYPLNTPAFNSASFGRTALVTGWLISGVLGLWMLAAMIRSIQKGGAKGALLLGGAFLTILGLRLMTLEYFGDRMPHWDYWSTPWTVYLPYQDGNLTWQAMFAPVNEHRIFFTRLLSLGLFLLNGQWENLYEALVMSVMHALTATGLALLLWNACRRKQAVIIFPLVIAATGLPFTWENIIWANQSQFYFFVAFSIMTIWLMGMHRPLTARWWLGASSALAAQFTVGSGILAPVVLAGLMVYKILRNAQRRDSAITLAAALALTGFAYLFRVDFASPGMLTRTVAQFIQTFGKTMSWPYTESIWLWVILWLPFFVFTALALIRRPEWSKAEGWVVALGGWVLLNALGVGIYRGGFSQGPISRYMDLTALGVVASGLALFLLPPLLADRQRVRSSYAVFRVVWLVLAFGGIIFITNHELNNRATSRLRHQQRGIENVRHFMRTDDLSFLLSKRHFEIPHPDAMALAAWLRSPPYREILPASIRDPLPLEPASMTGFVSPGVWAGFDFDIQEPAWGSYGREGDRTVGHFTSKPLPPPRHRYLMFPALGRLDTRQDTVVLRVVDQDGKRHRVGARRDGGEEWKPVYVRVPRQRLVVEAFDDDHRFWVAFQAPREVSTLSYGSFRIIQLGPGALSLGLLLLIGLAVREWGTRRHQADNGG